MHKWLGSPAPLRCRALVVILSLGTSRHLVARHFSSSCRSALLVVLSLGTSRHLVEDLAPINISHNAPQPLCTTAPVGSGLRAEHFSGSSCAFRVSITALTRTEEKASSSFCPFATVERLLVAKASIEKCRRCGDSWCASGLAPCRPGPGARGRGGCRWPGCAIWGAFKLAGADIFEGVNIEQQTGRLRRKLELHCKLKPSGCRRAPPARARLRHGPGPTVGWAQTCSGTASVPQYYLGYWAEPRNLE